MLWIVILCLVSTTVKANDDLMHFAAHAGASYAINTVFYGLLYKKGWVTKYQEDIQTWDDLDTPPAVRPPKSRVPSLMLAGFATLMVGFLYKHFETPKPTFQNMSSRMIFNASGVAASIGSIYVFDF